MRWTSLTTLALVALSQATIADAFDPFGEFQTLLQMGALSASLEIIALLDNFTNFTTL